ncbi:bifunctional 2-polyprenyl-6-hydroxyphenol methylase/3-demethylubiquinol 3-O-methyltransferase UbiG [Tateyamaria sp. syn59]|uniref:class I SAM-dependent methyltransferase n=1 Tax=Tateyamaria sp. syn59 TaxID=2576942 RepID=UPI0011BE15A1|nr:class I SAM-dependent methyltransferase [Tateyamaria sp. syn59]
MSSLIDTWSKDPSEEDGMTHEHAWIWREMIRCIPHSDLSDKRILDIGCNQGGFLRMLYDTYPFAAGTGVDLARDRIALAEAAKGSRPLTYLATPTLTDAGQNFDLAFSHEVIYLISDLEHHAKQVITLLAPGGRYDAVTCCHADNPLWKHWRAKIKTFSNIEVPSHSVAQITQAFRTAGFEVSVSRFLAQTPIPAEGPSDYFPSDLARIDTYCTWKLCFSCHRPA